MKSHQRNRIISFAISVLLTAAIFFSGVMSVVAWTDFTQSKTNEFSGTVARTTATLHKYEKDQEGNVISNPVRNAEFQLFKVEAQDVELQIGGIYQTDQSGKITVENLNSGNYYFKETNPGYGYEYDKDSEGAEIRNYPFTIAVDDSLGMAIVEVDAYNRRLTGALEIQKTVLGVEIDTEQQFEFTILFSDGKDYPYRLKDAEEESTLNAGKLLLRHGEYALFENLPVGVYYQVVETPDARYITQSTNNQGNIRIGETSVAEFVNIVKDDETGNLEIKKIVSGDLSNPKDSFTFQVDFLPAGVYSYKKNGTGESIAFTSGDTLELKHEEYALFEHLPVNTAYTVTETSAGEDAYMASLDTMSGNIIPGIIQALFHNRKDSDQESPGSLEINKTVTGGKPKGTFTFTVTFTGEEAKDKAFAYTINDQPSGSITNSGTIKLKHGETAVFTDLPSGIRYEVTESERSGYLSGVTKYQGMILSDSSVLANFYNYKHVREPVNLTVEKIVTGEIPESEKEREFWFTFQRNEESPLRFSLKAGEKTSFTVEIGDTYSVTEDDPFQYGYIQTLAVKGFGTVDEPEILVSITNTYIGTIQKTIEGEKTWILNGADPSVIPGSIQIKLKQDKETIETKTVIPDANGKWNYQFLAAKYDEHGQEINYTLEEVPIPGFETSINGTQITNTFTGKTQVTVTKVWDDGNNKNRPEEVQVQLYKNGVAQGTPIPLNAANQWTHTWSQLDTQEVWTVEEVHIPEGYTRIITGSASSGYIITNTLPKADQKVTVSGYKTWNHGKNPVSEQPDSITVYIKNGTAVAATAKVTAKSNWAWSFSLPKYDAEGIEITYTVDEEPVSDYSKTVSGYNLINTYSPGKKTEDGDSKVTISGTKTWNFKEAPESGRPGSITVYVKKDSTTVAEKIVTAADNWNYRFTLPRYESDGVTEIRYRIEEGNVPYYTGKVEGYNLMNTYQGKDYPGDTPTTGNRTDIGGNPVTGDNSRLWLWPTLFLSSIATLAIFMITKRKRKDRAQDK